jgi:predicted nucleic-acid-binding Zn-ribbon protein
MPTSFVIFSFERNNIIIISGNGETVSYGRSRFEWIQAGQLMDDHTVRKCPKCGQRLRIPEKLGGMLMACPSCGNKLYSEFKLRHTGSGGHRNGFITLFEMPDTILSRIRRIFTSK